MVERRSRLRFLLEAFQVAGIGREMGGKKLDGDGATQAGIASAVDDAHAARSALRKMC